jgi:hypothetical protein
MDVDLCINRHPARFALAHISSLQIPNFKINIKIKIPYLKPMINPVPPYLTYSIPPLLLYFSTLKGKVLGEHVFSLLYSVLHFRIYELGCFGLGVDNQKLKVGNWMARIWIDGWMQGMPKDNIVHIMLSVVLPLSFPT